MRKRKKHHMITKHGKEHDMMMKHHDGDSAKKAVRFSLLHPMLLQTIPFSDLNPVLQHYMMNNAAQRASIRCLSVCSVANFSNLV